MVSPERQPNKLENDGEFLLGGASFEPTFRHSSRDLAKKALEEAHSSWQQTILTRDRINNVDRLKKIELDQVHYNREILRGSTDLSLTRFIDGAHFKTTNLK